MTKPCYRCKTNPRAKRSKGYASYCKPCIAEYNKARRRDPEKMRVNSLACKRRAYELLEELDELKRKTPCKDCSNYFHPWQMQFDHVRGEKVDNISSMAAKGATNKVKKEVKKCEIVCANCHAHRTHLRGGVSNRKRKPNGRVAQE